MRKKVMKRNKIKTKRKKRNQSLKSVRISTACFLRPLLKSLLKFNAANIELSFGILIKIGKKYCLRITHLYSQKSIAGFGSFQLFS